MTVFADDRFDKLNDLLEDKLVTVIVPTHCTLNLLIVGEIVEPRLVNMPDKGR